MTVGSPTDDKPVTPVPFQVAIALQGGIVLFAVAVGWFLPRTPLEQIDWTAEGVGWGLLAALPMVLGLLLLFRYPTSFLKALDAVVEELVLPNFRRYSHWQLFVISLLAGLGEELLFRSVVQAGIVAYTGSPWLAVPMASVLFGLAHPITRTYVVLAALIGVYLGWLALATDNLLVPIVAHALYDFIALEYLLNRAPADSPTAERVSHASSEG